MRRFLYRVANKLKLPDYFIKRIDRERWRKDNGIYSATYSKDGIERWDIDLNSPD